MVSLNSIPHFVPCRAWITCCIHPLIHPSLFLYTPHIKHRYCASLDECRLKSDFIPILPWLIAVELFRFVRLKWIIHVWKSLVGKTDRLGRVFLFVFNYRYCIHIHIHNYCHIQSNTPIETTHLDSKSPDIHLLMLWQLVHLFIVEEVMKADRSSWSSCLRGLLYSTWLVLCPEVLIQRDRQLGVGLKHNKCIDLWADLCLWSVFLEYVQHSTNLQESSSTNLLACFISILS